MAAPLMRDLLLALALAWFVGAAAAAEPHGQNVLVLRADGENFEQTMKALRDDIGDEVTLVDTVMSATTSPDDLATAIKRLRPRAIVLLGNSPIGLYKSYQRSFKADDYPPALALSALYVDQLIAGMRNATGIRYEIPAVTSLVQLRALAERPVRRVGVLYRAWMEENFQANRTFAAVEGFELVGVRLPDEVTFEQLDYHLRHLVRDDRVDALWVINDNGLLTKRMLQNAWLPALRRFDKPVIVGVEALAGSELGFGTLAISPDNYALGIQAADRLVRIMDAGWRIDDLRIEEPLAARKLLNLALMRKKAIRIDTARLGEFDRVIE